MKAVTPSQGTRLTDRELEILLLVMQGHTNREIGRRLYIEVNTVKTHLSRIGKKLGMNSRVDMAVWASNNLTSYQD